MEGVRKMQFESPRKNAASNLSSNYMVAIRSLCYFDRR